MFSFLFTLLTPHKYRPLSITLAFSLFPSFRLRMFCTSQTSLGAVYLLAYILCPSIPPLLRHPILFKMEFFYCLPYRPISYGWQPLFGRIAYIKLPFHFSHVSIRCRWVNAHLSSQYCVNRCTREAQYVFSPFHPYGFQLVYQHRVLFGYVCCIFQVWHNHIHFNVSLNPSATRVCQDRIHRGYVYITRSYRLCYVRHPKTISWRALRQGRCDGLRTVVNLLPTSI